VDTDTWTVTTLAGISGDRVMGAESDGFGFASRFIEGMSLVLSDGTSASQHPVLIVGEAASLRAMATDTGQVATLAGALVADPTFWNVQTLAATGGQAFVPTAFGELKSLSVSRSTPVVDLPRCQAGFHVSSGMVVQDHVLFEFDGGLGGICRIDTTSGEARMVYQSEVAKSWTVSSLATDGESFYAVDRRRDVIWRIDPDNGTADELRVAEPLLGAWGAVALDGALYVTLMSQNQIVRVNPSTGSLRPLADGAAETRDGAIGSASVCHPAGIAAREGRDGTTRLYVGEAQCSPAHGAYQGRALREIDLGTEQITTLVGPGAKPNVVEGIGQQASLNWPAGIAYDEETDALYVVDRWDNVVLEID
jgi:hypothetical protein